MSNEVKKYLQDILTSLEAIDLHLNHKRDFNFYVKSLTVRRAIERDLEIIGEVTNRILKIDSNIPITSARLIVDLRNKVIHGYDTVDEIIIWKIINRDLPVLKAEVEKLLLED